MIQSPWKFLCCVTLVAALLVVAMSMNARADSRAERLVDMLESSSSYRVRAQCALSLGRLAARSTVPDLIDALEDSHPMVRTAAAISLGRIGSPVADSALTRVASDGSQPPEVVEQARNALQRIRQVANR